MNISNYLNHGESNATSTAELCRLLGVQRRVITRAVHAERVAGVLILSNDKGFYLPGDIGEVESFCRRMGHRISEIAKAKQTAEKVLLQYPEQLCTNLSRER